MALEAKNLTFFYPGSETAALDDVSISVSPGEIVLLMGISGSGKSTLLRHLKPELTPVGVRSGSIVMDDVEMEKSDGSCGIGYVFQSPSDQMVSDSVWQELSFGLENMGLPSDKIRCRVAEISSFFGIGHLINKMTFALSGGEKQLINLAGIMAMDPKYILLDEPVSMLDPVSAERFLKAIEKIKNELGVGIIICEHRGEDIFQICDKVVVLDNGRVIACDTPRSVAKTLMDSRHPLAKHLPLASRMWKAFCGTGDIPITVGEGRKLLKCGVYTPEYSKKNKSENEVLNLRNVSFSYGRDERDILKNVSLSCYGGEVLSIAGANGSGKSTLLSVIGGLIEAYMGSVTYCGKTKKQYRNKFYGQEVVTVPQDPTVMFSKDSVEKEISDYKMGCEMGLTDIMKRHPFDISGGEQQMTACCMGMGKNAKILLLDEPTKGLDEAKKDILGEMIKKLASGGTLVIIATHDLDFCSKYSDRCGLLFDGEIVSIGSVSNFFSQNLFYTTSAARMTRGIIPGIVTEAELMSMGGESR